MTGWQWIVCVGACAAMAGVSATGRASAPIDPLAFVRPTIAVTPAERERLRRGDVLVRMLAAQDGDVAVFAAAKMRVAPDTMVAWIRAIDQLKRSSFVPVIRRFSDPPALEDLEALVLDDSDVEDIRACRGGDCHVKLGADDMVALQAAASASGPDWKDAVRRQFRLTVLARVNTYRAGGYAAVPAYADRTSAVRPAETFAGILSRSAFLGASNTVVSQLRDYPRPAPAMESFFYWSKEQYGHGKPVVSVTHVNIFRSAEQDGPAVLVTGNEIFATHYRNGSLGVTALVADEHDEVNYLVYVNRSNLDVLGGLFGGMKRAILEARIKGETATVIGAIRDRMSSGPPLPFR